MYGYVLRACINIIITMMPVIQNYSVIFIDHHVTSAWILILNTLVYIFFLFSDVQSGNLCKLCCSFTKMTMLPHYFCSGFFPVAVNFLRRVPVIGTILNLPGIRSVSYENCCNLMISNHLSPENTFNHSL